MRSNDPAEEPAAHPGSASLARRAYVEDGRLVTLGAGMPKIAAPVDHTEHCSMTLFFTSLLLGCEMSGVSYPSHLGAGMCNWYKWPRVEALLLTAFL